MQFCTYKLKESYDELVCTDHQYQPIFVLMDENLDIKDRLVCIECLRQKRGSIQPKTLNQIQEIILERIQNRNIYPENLILESIKQGEEIRKKMKIYKIQANQQLRYQSQIFINSDKNYQVAQLCEQFKF